MFSDLDDAFTALRERAPEPRFAPAEAVRRRGRRRTHRQVVVAAVAVVGLAAGAGALVARPMVGGRDEPAVPASARPTASPATQRVVPNERMLQPTDVPTGYRVGSDTDERSVGLPVFLACVNTPLTWESSAHGRGSRRIVFAGVDAMRAKLWLIEEQIQQAVLLFDDGWAARALVEYRAWISACAVPAGVVVEARDQDFAGDESVVYRIEQRAQAPYHLAIVRVGDRVTTLRIGSAFKPETARDLATKAAARLAP